MPDVEDSGRSADVVSTIHCPVVYAKGQFIASQMPDRWNSKQASCLRGWLDLLIGDMAVGYPTALCEYCEGKGNIQGKSCEWCRCPECFGEWFKCQGVHEV